MSHTAPSLFGQAPAAPKADVPRTQRTLCDLMHDGFYLLFMLRRRSAPTDAAAFRDSIRRFLDEFEKNARRNGASADDIFASKYAFCAAVDEVILGSAFNVREAWERQPLQLALFGEQLAGERFFEHLEQLRAQGAARVQALEVFHHCLLHGFRGKYMLEGPERLNYLIARVGDEVAHHKGRRTGFAPNAALPDQVRNLLRTEVPLWVIVSVIALVGAITFTGLRVWLARGTEREIGGYHEVVKLAPRNAHVTITLP